MLDPFVGQILLFPFNFPPNGFAFCQGQFLPIAQNTALFSLLGTTYGGDGKTNFALPNLRGRVPHGIRPGAGPDGLSAGGKGRHRDHHVAIAQMPQHTHAMTSARDGGVPERSGQPADARRQRAGD